MRFPIWSFLFLTLVMGCNSSTSLTSTPSTEESPRVEANTAEAQVNVVSLDAFKQRVASHSDKIVAVDVWAMW